MTRVSTAASVPLILHISTVRAVQIAARRGRLEKLGDASFHHLRARKVRASRFSSSCEKVGKKKRTLTINFSPVQAGWPCEKKQVRELCEKSVHFQSLHIAVCRQAAPVAEFADRCRIHLQGLASHGFCFQCTKTFGFHWHDFGHLSISCTPARPRRCKTRARPTDSFSSSLLLTNLLPRATRVPLRQMRQRRFAGALDSRNPLS